MTAPSYAAAADPRPPRIASGEQRLILHGVTWEQYEIVRAALDDYPGLRMTYLEGELEIMSPSRDHEGIKKMLARLLEMYAVECGVPLNGFGSTTFRKRAKERGLEPDECYSVGPFREVPDIAIEVVLSHGGIDKLEVYRGLGIPEVWFWEDGGLTVHWLEGERYVPVPKSRFLPDLDIDQLLGFLATEGDQTATVRAYRDALRA